ncbi:hypothetical protein ABIA33_006312 [Streptacidiphilus sp. MAP12-16]|uniref:hypothetical protein n=1 Tax=Streptacidiphilus sp. MAP12-16 TaxID=3156300 RepID=UPI003512C0E6
MDQASIDRRVLAQRDADGWLFLGEAALAALAALRDSWRTALRPRSPADPAVPRGTPR